MITNQFVMLEKKKIKKMINAQQTLIESYDQELIEWKKNYALFISRDYTPLELTLEKSLINARRQKCVQFVKDLEDLLPLEEELDTHCGSTWCGMNNPNENFFCSQWEKNKHCAWFVSFESVIEGEKNVNSQ